MKLPLYNREKKLIGYYNIPDDKDFCTYRKVFTPESKKHMSEFWKYYLEVIKPKEIGEDMYFLGDDYEIDKPFKDCVMQTLYYGRNGHYTYHPKI